MEMNSIFVMSSDDSIGKFVLDISNKSQTELIQEYQKYVNNPVIYCFFIEESPEFYLSILKKILWSYQTDKYILNYTSKHEFWMGITLTKLIEYFNIVLSIDVDDIKIIEKYDFSYKFTSREFYWLANNYSYEKIDKKYLKSKLFDLCVSCEVERLVKFIKLRTIDEEPVFFTRQDENELDLISDREKTIDDLFNSEIRFNNITNIKEILAKHNNLVGTIEGVLNNYFDLSFSMIHVENSNIFNYFFRRFIENKNTPTNKNDISNALKILDLVLAQKSKFTFWSAPETYKKTNYCIYGIKLKTCSHIRNTVIEYSMIEECLKKYQIQDPNYTLIIEDKIQKVCDLISLKYYTHSLDYFISELSVQDYCTEIYHRDNLRITPEQFIVSCLILGISSNLNFISHNIIFGSEINFKSGHFRNLRFKLFRKY